MRKRFKKITLETLGLYILLALTALMVPKNIMDLSRFWFNLMIAAYVFLWYKNLRRLWFKVNDNDPRDNWDFLIYDLIYILGLPIIFNLIMFKVGRGLFNSTLQYVFYYGILGFIVILKFALMGSRSKHYYVFRYVITVLFVMGNIVVINAILSMWFGMNFLGQGF